VKVKVIRTFLVTLFVGSASLSYGIGLSDILPAPLQGMPQIPEPLSLLFQGLAMLLVAHNLRQWTASPKHSAAAVGPKATARQAEAIPTP
jgi:hypothetical protein